MTYAEERNNKSLTVYIYCKAKPIQGIIAQVFWG